MKKISLDYPTLLAVTRTRFAAERTLMAWIRTSFSMITFGFGIMKFFQYLSSQNHMDASHLSGATQLGIFLILLGIFSLFPGMIEHRKILSELSKHDGKPSWSYAFVVGIFVGLIGIYMLTRAIAIRLF